MKLHGRGSLSTIRVSGIVSGIMPPRDPHNDDDDENEDQEEEEETEDAAVIREPDADE